MFSAVLFYIYSFILLASAGMVICSKNLVHGLIFLILCFVNAACLFILIGAEFLAFILLIIYAGAVAILFLFIIMTLDIRERPVNKSWKKYLPVGIIVGLVLLAELIMTNIAFEPIVEKSTIINDIGNTHAIGNVLYTKYFLPFQVCGLILLTAMIGAITLNVKEEKTHRKRQISSDQINISVKNVIKMHSDISKDGIKI